MLSGKKADNIPTSSRDVVKFSIYHGSLYFKDCLIWLYFYEGNKFPTIPRKSHIPVKEIIQMTAEEKKKKNKGRNSRGRGKNCLSSGKTMKRKLEILNPSGKGQN